MNRIPQEVINDIRSKARIEEVIGHYITVMKKGNSYLAYCPFHDDHDPSLHISADKQIFKCFSCPAEEGSAGDVFKFVMKYKHVDYLEAIKMVAELIGYKYDFGDDRKTVVQESIYHKINRDTIAFCQYQLNTQEGASFKEYLHNRFIDDGMIEKYCIGYNPGNNKLSVYLNKKGYKDQDIIKANLARLTSNGLNDVFYNRIMIPIFDGEGRPIGFTARTLDPQSNSKYINTAETPLFHKSDVVFNLHRAKEIVREKKFMIIAEGPMDVMALERGGYGNAVCSMGTATTVNQLNQIRRYTRRLLLAYDGDKAGQGAILRTGKMALENGFEVLVINNRTEYDPDEIINKYGDDELKAMIEKPMAWMEFILNYYQKEYDISNFTNKKEYIRVVMEQINQLKDPLDRDNYKRQLAEITKVSYAVLDANQPQNISQQIAGKVRESQQPITKPVTLMNGMRMAQMSILKEMLLSYKAIEIFKKELMKLPDSQYQDLALHIIDYASQHDRIDEADLMSQLSDELQPLLYDITESELIADEYNEELLKDSIITIQIDELKSKAKELESQISQLNDDIVKGKILLQSDQIKKQIAQLNKQKSKKIRRTN